eukprot:2717570-Prymnesium_polylepis.1
MRRTGNLEAVARCDAQSRCVKAQEGGVLAPIKVVLRYAQEDVAVEHQHHRADLALVAARHRSSAGDVEVFAKESRAVLVIPAFAVCKDVGPLRWPIRAPGSVRHQINRLEARAAMFFHCSRAASHLASRS